MQTYFKATHTAYYSIITALPLLIIYEILLALTSTPYWVIRNAADVWLRYLLTAFDLTSKEATFVMIGILFIAIPIVQRKHDRLQFRYLAGMAGEAFLYSWLLLMFAYWQSQIFLANPIVQSSFLQRLALSLGAGLFEEFFFRVLLLNALFYALNPFMKKSVFAVIVAILLASLFFSLSHYIGNMADAFYLRSFLFRWMAGLIFTILYFMRGFAVTAYTHAFYDMWVLL